MNGWNPPTITTKRLVIRPMSVADLQSVHAFTNAYSVSQYGNWLGSTDAASVARYMADTIARYGRPPRCDLGVTFERQLIGGLAFRQVWLSPPAMEVGWVLHPSLSGKGLATEALSALLQYLRESFPEVSRFEARVQASDTGAKNVLGRLSFQAEGTLRGGFDSDGNPTDSAMYGLLRSELG